MKNKLALWNKLVPGCKTTGCEYDDSLKWADERPEPTQKEMSEGLIKFDFELSLKKKKEKAYKKLKDKIKMGVVFNNDIFPCDIDTIILYSVINNSGQVLNITTNTKHIIIKTINGKIKKMTANQFTKLFEKVNDYYYSMIKDYWNEIEI